MSVDWRVYEGGHVGRFPMGDAAVRALSHAPPGDLWAVVGAMLLLYREGRWRRVPAQVDVRPEYENYPRGSFAWFRDALWVGGSILMVNSDSRWERVPDVPLTFVYHLIVDSSGYLWAGSMRDGLCRTADGRTWASISLPNQEGKVETLGTDHDGNVHVIALDSGTGKPALSRWHEGQQEWELLHLPGRPARLRNLGSLLGDSEGTILLSASGPERLRMVFSVGRMIPGPTSPGGSR